jgi:uncharacterized protein YjiS (DUF1127 family)
MFTLRDIVAAFRRNQVRRAAIRDLQRLSREQLSDVGIPPDQLGDAVDAMLAHPRPVETGVRIPRAGRSSARVQQPAAARR